MVNVGVKDCKGYLIYIDPIGKILHIVPYIFSDVALEKTQCEFLS